MATDVKSADVVAKKWGDVTPGRSSYYEANAPAAADKQNKNAIAASAAYKAAVSAGNIDQMFRGGLVRAGAAKYARKTAGVGKDRFGPGVSAAIDDYKAGEAPMLDTIAGVTPPARQPRGNPANQARSVAYQVALNKKRLALRAAGG